MIIKLIKNYYKKLLSLLLTVALLTPVFAITLQTAKAATAIGTIPAGTCPYAIAANPMTNKVYVANYSSGNVTVIDGNDNSTSTVAAGTTPRAIAVNPETNSIYVANSGSSNVTVIDGNDNSTDTITAGSTPYAIAVNPVTNNIYVANSGSSNITVIDGNDNSTDTVTAGTSPYAVAVNPVANKVYVANYGSDNVTVIDGTGLSTQTVVVGDGPMAIAVNPATNKIYVANSGSGDVTVIDGTDNSTATITAGSKPQAITLNPVTNNIYVANFNSNNVTVIDGADNSTDTVATSSRPQAITVNTATNKLYTADIGGNNVTVIDGDDNSTATVATGSRPTAIAVSAVTGKVYTANFDSNDVTVIDGDDNHTDTISTLYYPGDVAVNPFTNKIYVADHRSNNVLIIDGADNSISTLKVGDYPHAIAVNPVTNKVYVANSEDDNVTVIDGTDLSTQTVVAGDEPYDIAVNPVTNKIYVANTFSDNVTVIDGDDNSTTTVATGSSPKAIAVNPATNKIYVANYGTYYITVIDGDDLSTQNVTAGAGHQSIAVNSVTNTIYVGNGTYITVVNGNDNSMTIIHEVNAPWAIAVNPATNKIYVANYFNDTVTVIDGTDNSKTTVAAGDCPYGIAVNTVTNKIYVGNLDSRDVTVIDAQDEHDGDLTVDIGPLTNNLTGNTTATFNLTSHSAYTPTTPGIRQIWYQVDTVTGKWLKASPAGGSAQVTLTELSRGTHILQAFATDGMEATSISTGYGTSSIIGEVAAYEFTVLDSCPIIMTQSLVGAVLQDDYSMTVSAEAGLAPYIWSAAGLPAGLSINTLTGQITGLPEEAGTFHPQINVADRDGIGTSKSFTMQVYSAPDGSGTLAVTPTEVDAGSGGNTVTFTYTPSGSGMYNGEITIELPAGWPLPNTVPGSGGYVSATAGTVSTNGQTITVNNTILPFSDKLDVTYSGVTVPGGAGSSVLLVKQKTTASGMLSMLSPLPEMIVNPDNTFPVWPVGAALNVIGRAINTVTFGWTDASDNIGVAGYKIYRNGSLEAEVGESANSYTASGLSAGTSYTFMVSAFDNAGNSADGPSAAVNTNTPMTVRMGAVPEGSVGAAYSHTLAASGGASPNTWAATGLPSGLGIDAATGKISGTPAAAGTGSVTATVIDSEGQRVTILFDITIGNSSMQIATASLPAGTVGNTYSQTLAASGGDEDYTWLTTGLPEGLKLNSLTGEISGRVQISDTYTVNIILLDGSGMKMEKTFTLSIAEQTVTGKYTVTPDTDSAYTIGSSGDIVTVTIKSGITGYKCIAALVTPIITHEGTETAVFTLIRGGMQIGLTSVKTDFDYDNHPTAGFNVKAGDVIKIYIVDDLSNATGNNPILLQ